MAPRRVRPCSPPTPLALRIQRARKKSGLPTDVAFAAACGIDARAFWRYTKDNVLPRPAVLRKIASVGGVDLAWLIGSDGESRGAA